MKNTIASRTLEPGTARLSICSSSAYSRTLPFNGFCDNEFALSQSSLTNSNHLIINLRQPTSLLNETPRTTLGLIAYVTACSYRLQASNFMRLPLAALGA